MSAQLLEIKGIRKEFPGTLALDEIDLTVGSGEIHALIGENGAGKSTFVKILAGEYRPDKGEIRIEGRAPSGSQADIGLIHQELMLVGQLTVAENVLLNRLPTGISGAINWKKAASLATTALQQLGVDIDPLMKVSDLEVGQQQLVEIARVISLKPKVLLLDEPTSALSDKSKEVLFAVLRRLQGQGVGMIYISHHLEELEKIADRITVLRDGCVSKVFDRGDTPKSELISAMVGRALDQQYPKVAITLGGAVLELSNISDGNVLKDISFTLNKGEILGVYGLLGAGQAKIPDILFGLAEFSGRLTVNGQPYHPKSPAQAIENGIGLLLRDRRDSLVPNFPVSPTVNLPNQSGKSLLGRLQFLRERSVTLEYIEELNISPNTLSREIRHYSGGNQQKALLARWMAAGSDILILDEPTRGIDVGAKAEVFKVVGDLITAGKSVLMISSELSELIGVCDRVLVMKAGKITSELSRSELNETELMKNAS